MLLSVIGACLLSLGRTACRSGKANGETLYISLYIAVSSVQPSLPPGPWPRGQPGQASSCNGMTMPQEGAQGPCRQVMPRVWRAAQGRWLCMTYICQRVQKLGQELGQALGRVSLFSDLTIV